MEKMIKALLVTLEGIQEVELESGNLDQYYELIQCDTMTGAGYPDELHAAWADDEGLLNLDEKDQANFVTWHPEPLVGRLLITGYDPETGESTSVTMTAEELEQKVSILPLFKTVDVASGDPRGWA